VSDQATHRARIDALLIRLRECKANDGDPESAHADADRALLDFIGDPEVTDAFEAIDKWYA